MSGSIAQGAGRTRGNAHILHFLVRLPRPMGDVWPAVATAEGLAGWCAAVDVLQPRLDGAVGLGELGSGRVTAWDVDRVAEYTFEGGGRIRFHLERDGDTASVLRFTREYRGEGESEADWRIRFERLVERLGSA
ncbi:hypothetical protein [Streptomyces sp. MMG1121]|uniref:hypothetical protein n=1 Tax=Streptomyces sp. MMG1121 TaxID=1415544 RepID=UPI0006B05295|nr:hypothetical protein [Streptomyces sp. MMG1121]KOV70738.1 hypothetical protein ADK64_02575 [Streptomyces sp. MMG1121]